MTRGAGAPRHLELELGSAAERLTLIGPAFVGAVYRSEQQPVFYRLVPVEEIPPAGRAVVREWQGRPRQPGVAPIVGSGHVPGKGWYFVRYGLPAEQTMADVLLDDDPRTRLRHAARALAACHGWSGPLGPGSAPMPAEIAFTNGDAHILPMPYRVPPGLDALVSEPERAWHLAPELVRGLSGAPSEGADHYALGVMLLRCFYALPPTRGDELLERVANGSAFDVVRLESSLPAWLARLDTTHEAVRAARVLTLRDPAARAAVDPAELGVRLEEIAREMEPAKAVQQLRRSDRAAEAFSLFQDVLLEEESYELLLLGGTIASEDVGRPLEAVDLFERAIAIAPTTPAAYEQQLHVILGVLSLAVLDEFRSSLGIGGDNTIASLERRMLRDCDRLIPELQAPFEEPIARCLLERGRYDQAAEFIRPRLFRGSEYLWWKFGLVIAYGHALFGQGRLDEAHELVGEAKNGLRRVRDNPSMPEDEIQRHGQALTELEVQIARRRSPGAVGGAAGGPPCR